MTSKNIFVMGCSFSHHDIYVEPCQTWPCLLQLDTGYKVINGSVPGNSNLSYFYRLKEMEKRFGFPDQVIVQITGLYRFFVMQKLVQICELEKLENREYYFEPYTEAYRTAGFSFPYGSKYIHKSRKLLYRKYGYEIGTLAMFSKYFGIDANTIWNNIKELLLINFYFKNTLFFSWNIRLPEMIQQYDLNYVGDLKRNLLSRTFDAYSIEPNKDYHFNQEGHHAVKETILNYV